MFLTFKDHHPIESSLIKVYAEDIFISCFLVLQQSHNDALKFESLVLVHDLVSQVTS